MSRKTWFAVLAAGIAAVVCCGAAHALLTNKQNKYYDLPLSASDSEGVYR